METRETAMKNLHKKTWEFLEASRAGDKAGRTFNIFMLSLIFLNVLAAIIGTVDSVYRQWGVFLDWFELLSVAVFTVEYIVRMWACTASEKYAGPIVGRIRFALRPMTLVDLASILPFYLPFVSMDARFLRMLRLLRIIRIVKIGHYYSSLQVIADVLRDKKEELILTTFMMLMLLLFSGSVMYYCEHDAQPEVFPDIPTTLWWAVITLTTVGYGDIYPVTPIGKMMGSIIAILGIGMFALPTGILGAGFVERIQKAKKGLSCCPHCGKRLDQKPGEEP